MVRKLTLDEPFGFETAAVFGLVCDVPAPQLCFALNEKLGLRLCRNPKDREHWYRKRPYFFMEFGEQQPPTRESWQLTSNKNPLTEAHVSTSPLLLDHAPSLSTRLVRDFKTVDYFLWSEEGAGSDTCAMIAQHLKTLRPVRAFQKIAPESSRHLENLLSP